MAGIVDAAAEVDDLGHRVPARPLKVLRRQIGAEVRVCLEQMDPPGHRRVASVDMHSADCTHGLASIGQSGETGISDDRSPSRVACQPPRFGPLAPVGPQPLADFGPARYG